MDRLSLLEFLTLLNVKTGDDDDGEWGDGLPADSEQEDPYEARIRRIDANPQVRVARIGWLKAFIEDGRADALEPFTLPDGRTVEHPGRWCRHILKGMERHEVPEEGREPAMVDFMALGNRVRELGLVGTSIREE